MSFRKDGSADGPISLGERFRLTSEWSGGTLPGYHQPCGLLTQHPSHEGGRHYLLQVQTIAEFLNLRLRATRHKMEKGLRIFTPIGMLGYGFSETIFWEILKQGVDAIILDSGSTDSGPSKLALGKPTVSKQSYERDLALLVAGVHRYQKPLLIGKTILLSRQQLF